MHEKLSASIKSWPKCERPRELLFEDIAKGTVDQSTVYPREVIQWALDLGASAVIFVHNHPSGSMEPSKSDIEITHKLISACRAVFILHLLIISLSRHFGTLALRAKFYFYDSNYSLSSPIMIINYKINLLLTLLLI